MRRALVFLVALLTVAGCAVGPDYERPGLAVPESFRGEISASEAESFANLPWFEVFRDAELEVLIREALGRNLDLRLALARVEEARAGARFARGAYGPDIRGVLNTTPAPGAGSNDANYTAGLALNWELDLFGKLRRADEAARASLLASEDVARGVMAALVARVATTWLTLRELDQQVEIIRRTIRSQEESLALVRSLSREGVASGAEEQQAIAQLAATRAALPLAEQQVIAAENALSVLLGRYPTSISRQPLAGGMLLPEPSAVPLGLPAELLERRPDVRAAEQNLRAATARVGVAVANRFPVPTIGVTALVGRTSTELGDLFSGDSSSLNSWGPVADLPILNFGRNQAQVEIARAQTRQALVGYRATVLQAAREVSDALVGYEKAAEVIVANEVFARAASESLRLARLRFRSGVISYLEVLDAERQLFSAELNLARSQLSRLLSLVTLYRALGGGWSDEVLAAALEAAEATD
ncbi:MAG TPA: efflux transporter outer membrane subunit [Woeseiaceae bacterium]|nr:efflux transporter outer membrane subunit [Woeseiaceae bacterium]